MRSPTASGRTREHRHVHPVERPARRRRHRGARVRADQGAPGARGDLARPRLARLRAERRGERAPASAGAGGQGDQRPVRDHPRRAAGHRAQGGDRGGAEAAMTLWWIGDVVLLLVILPVVAYLLRGVLEAARSIVPSVRQIATVAAAGSKDLDAAALLLTTKDQVEQTVAGVAAYGGSLDVIVDDAPEERR